MCSFVQVISKPSFVQRVIHPFFVPTSLHRIQSLGCNNGISDVLLVGIVAAGHSGHCAVHLIEYLSLSISKRTPPPVSKSNTQIHSIQRSIMNHDDHTSEKLRQYEGPDLQTHFPGFLFFIQERYTYTHKHTKILRIPSTIIDGFGS